MENINELILTEFSQAGYSVIGEIEHSPILANEAKSDFWMIFGDFDKNEDAQLALYDKYRYATDSYPAADKNISVLVLKKEERIVDEKRQWAVEIENDKFFFKKYVLLYTDESFAKLQDEILVDAEKNLSDYLCDRNVFEQLKEDTPDGAYTLLYGIAHKLPFLLVQMEKSHLKLAYPEYWSSSSVLETNDWVNDFPDVEEAMDTYLDEILNSIDDGQD